MPLLSIDTSDIVTGTALFHNGEFVAEKKLILPKGRDAALSLMVKDTLEDSGIKFKELEGVAVSEGPGSFTGLRVGIAYAKGICSAMKIPLIGVATLETLARCAAGYHDRLILTLIHARRDEVYSAAFKMSGIDLIQVWKEKLSVFTEPISRINEPAVVLGSGYDKHREAVDEMLPKSCRGISFSDLLSTVLWVAILGAQKLEQGIFQDIKSFEPKYLQQFPRNT